MGDGGGGGGRKITIEWLQIAFTLSGRGLICFILYKKTMEKKKIQLADWKQLLCSRTRDKNSISMMRIMLIE